MPGFDQTGPLGMGPRTGGGRGFCAPGTGPYAHTYRTYGGGSPFIRGASRGGIPWGGGRGRASGGGRGWRCYQPFPYAPYGVPPFSYNEPGIEAEKESLKHQASFLEDQLQDIKNRIAALEQKEKPREAE